MRGGWVKHKLTATKVKQALPRHRAYKLADGNGLYLRITTNGTKCWRYNYRGDRKEKTLPSVFTRPFLWLQQETSIKKHNSSCVRDSIPRSKDHFRNSPTSWRQQTALK